MKPEESSLEYIKGLSWIYNYYFKNKLDYNWYYPYEKAPLIYDLNNTLQKLDSLTFKTEDYPLIMTPINNLFIHHQLILHIYYLKIIKVSLKHFINN
jgi:hypothetical protein